MDICPCSNFARMRNRRVREGSAGPQRRSTEVEKAAKSRGDQSHASDVHDGRETNGPAQIRCIDGSLRSARITVDDDLSIEITVGVQPVAQANANQENAKDAEAGKTHETK